MFESLEENEPAEQKPTDWTGVIIAAVLAPVYWFFARKGNDDIALSVFICLGMILLAIKIRWDLRRRVWFWVVIAIMLALHVPLILKTRWTGFQVTRLTLLPIGLADLLVTLGVIWLVETCLVTSAPDDEG